MKISLKNNLPYLIIGSLMFVYIVVRAFFIPLAYDEAWTIVHLVPTWVFDAGTIANNHFLNTFLIKLSSFIFGDSVFVDRLPNVLAFLVYAYFSYKIVSTRLSIWMGTACFVALLSNPFLIDYFSVARGYGLSIACMMASLYYGLENIKEYSRSTLTKSLVWASFSVFAIFSMVYFWMILAIALNFVVFLQQNKETFKESVKRSFKIGLILFPLLRLIIGGHLYHGGENNLFSDTLVTFINHSLYYYSGDHPFVQLIAWGVVATFFVVVLLSFYYRRAIVSNKSFFLFIFLGLLLLITVAHYLGGVRYPIDRNAIFFYPLFVLCLWFCLVDWQKYLRWILIAFLLTVSVGNFSKHVSVDRAAIFGLFFYGQTVDALQQINKAGEVEGKIMSINYTWEYEPFMKYLLDVKKDNLPFVQMFDPEDKKRYKDLIEAGTEVDYLMCSQLLDDKELIGKKLVLERPKTYLFLYKHVK